MRRTLVCALMVLAACRPSTLPPAVTDAEFQTLMDSLSEPAGVYAISDNLVSNEPRFAENARWIGSHGGVYVGVGPEQNFSYLVRLRPALAFVIDIRRENRNLHLLYKALFEMSADRADFVSRLFSRPRPAGLDTGSSAATLFERFAAVAPSSETRDVTASLVRDRLIAARHLTLTSEDLASIDRILDAFYKSGPDIQFWSSGSVATDRPGPSYRQLMTMRDMTGQLRSFLADEKAFRFVKGLQSRNLIVPVVGDFAGAKAMRAVGTYLKGKGAVVSAFYLSNVEEYLRQNGVWLDFCANVSELPRDRTSTFIRSTRSGSDDPAEALRSEIGPMSAISNCR